MEEEEDTEEELKAEWKRKKIYRQRYSEDISPRYRQNTSFN